MDIIKRLQLNKNPKDIKSGSVIGAKNIILDPISSTITNEYGFKCAYNAPNGYNIVGVIPCNEELVIFLSTSNKTNSKIERLKDGEVIGEPVNCNWKYEGGKITGTFAYNYKKQLIIAVSEYDANHDVPLKILNLDDNTLNLNNNLEEDIPSINCNYLIGNSGSLVCGTYTFFIRFKIDEQTYTKWFQVTDDIIITNIIGKDAPVHTYTNQGMNKVIKVNTDNFNKLVVNENLSSVCSINFNIAFNNNKFSEYQLGYIIKRETETLGRLYKEYSVDDLNISVIDNSFLEEVSINDFLEIPTQFFNCKNVINYNNRLYISNYNTYKNKEIDTNNLVDVSIKLIEVNDEISLKNNQLNISRGQLYNSSYAKETNVPTIPPITNFVPQRKNHNESVQFVRDYIYPLCKSSTYNGNLTIVLFRPDDCSMDNAIIIYSDNGTNINNEYYIDFIDGRIHVITSNYDYILNGTNCINLALHNKHCWAYNKTDLGIPLDREPNALGWINSSYTTDENIISNVDIKYNNNRTLIPGQTYNFFIHFIRKDGSYTEGYNLINKGTHKVKIPSIPPHYINVDNLEVCSVNNTNITDEFYFYKNDKFFQCPRFINKTIKTDNNRREFIIVPVFNVNESLIDSEFVGYFISYERIEITSLPVVSLNDDGFPAKDNYKYTSSDIIYNNKTLKGNKLCSGFSAPGMKGFEETIEEQQVDIKNTSIYTSNYKEKHLILDLDESFYLETFYTPNNDYNSYKSVIKINRNLLYNSKYKVLYRLTPNVYKNDEYKVDSAYMYLPGFYNREKVIYYDKEVLFDAAGTFVYQKDSTPLENSYAIKSICYRNYSHSCLNALSIKKDYEKAVVSLNINNIVQNVVNKVLSPDDLKDFLELQQSYKSEPILSYTNYNKNTQDSFDKTIYRSDIISDESLTNGFRHFNIENYKNIIENKGNIINIVGFGLYMLVHTEYSLFVFDRNNQLSENAQLQIPDVFDIDYKEMIPSGEGFGGLKDKEESILTKHGYIWFDHITKSIFIFDGQQIKPISADIHILLKQYMRDDNYAYIRFAEDYISNRLLITIRSDYNVSTYITLSYSFDTDTFISLHDYTFDNNYKTYNNSYLFSKEYNNKLFIWDKRTLDFDNFKTNKHPLFETIKYNDKICSYVDIIFNDLYETPKTLNSISYILSRNNYYGYSTNIIDQYFNTDFDNEKHQNKEKLYSGFKLFICTDLTFSGELDISKPLYNESKTGGVKDLKIDKPVWNNGVWNFNWFRENIKKDVTNAELEQQNVNQQMKEVYQEHDNLYPSGLEKSDMRALINGKYFIFRFIFERNEEDLDLRFETLDANISRL